MTIETHLNFQFQHVFTFSTAVHWTPAALTPLYVFSAFSPVILVLPSHPLALPAFLHCAFMPNANLILHFVPPCITILDPYHLVFIPIHPCYPFLIRPSLLSSSKPVQML